MEAKKFDWRKLITLAIIIIIVPAVIVLGYVVFKAKSYNVISIVIAFLACVPFFVAYERKLPQIREMVILAVMIALSVVSRCLFAFIPAFKPITAMVIISGIFLGKEAGFLTGALSAVMSNMFFGQGAWTPFQMFVWGIIGFVAGIFGERINKWWCHIIFGTIAGVAFSLIMDIWTVLSFGDGFSLSRYVAALATSLPWMGGYIVSNVVFLLLLCNPIGNRLNRLKVKYNIFGYSKAKMRMGKSAYKLSQKQLKESQNDNIIIERKIKLDSINCPSQLSNDMSDCYLLSTMTSSDLACDCNRCNSDNNQLAKNVAATNASMCDNYIALTQSLNNRKLTNKQKKSLNIQLRQCNNCQADKYFYSLK